MSEEKQEACRVCGHTEPHNWLDTETNTSWPICTSLGCICWMTQKPKPEPEPLAWIVPTQSAFPAMLVVGGVAIVSFTSEGRAKYSASSINEVAEAWYQRRRKQERDDEKVPEL